MHFIRIVILCLACLGHVVIVRAMLNFMYRFSLKELVWRSVVLLHALAATAGPPVMLVIVVGTPWDQVPEAWRAYMTLCVAALAVGLAVSVANRLRRPPAAQLSNHTIVVDIARQIGRRPTHGRFAAFMAAMPGNDLFRVEVVERQVVCPRLPAQLDGISILHVSDLHLNGTPTREFFERAFEVANDLSPDLIAFTGDLMDARATLAWLPTTLGKLHAPLGRFFILGNHDARTDAELARRAMVGIGWTDLGAKFLTTESHGRPILLAGTEVPWIGQHPDLSSAPPADFRILLSHTPHSLPFARENDFDLMLAGHLHGGQVRLPLVGAVIGGRMNGGLFDVPPTLVHVSRGLGELSPLRVMCRPEVTKLVLRCAGS